MNKKFKKKYSNIVKSTVVQLDSTRVLYNRDTKRQISIERVEPTRSILFLKHFQ